MIYWNFTEFLNEKKIILKRIQRNYLKEKYLKPFSRHFFLLFVTFK